MNVVNGKDVRLYAYLLDGYYLFACASEMTLTEQTEVLSTTSPASGNFRTFRTRLSDWKLSLRGLLFLQSDASVMWMALDLYSDGVRQGGLPVKVKLTDESGLEKTITGNVFIPSKSITATAGSLAKWQSEFQGSGAYTLT